MPTVAEHDVFVEQEVREADFAFVYLDVDDPHVAWLTYRGQLNSCDIATANPGNISWFLTDVIKRGLVSTLRREGSLEGFRLREFPSLPSRLRCVYAYPTLDAAIRGNYGRGKFRKENLVAIAPAVSNFSRSMHDSNWITDFDSLPVDTARKYWAGDTTKNPHFECLLNGRFWIFGTTVRKRAYETIKRIWPNTLAMLELSRLAVEFGSDLGASSPWVIREDDQVMVRHIIKYDEKEGLDVFRKTLERAKQDRSFQVNWADLEPLRKPANDKAADGKFCMPDSRPYDHVLREDKLTTLKGYIGFEQEPAIAGAMANATRKR